MLCCAVMLAVACARPDQTETPESPVSSVPVSTPRPSQTPIQTDTPEPTRTPTRRPTVTPEPVHLLPAGWQQLGDARFGLQAGTPEHWIDASASFRSNSVFERFGPHLLLLADSDVTSASLLSGVPPSAGAFIFGFLTDSQESELNPVEALTGRLAVEDALEGQAIEVTTLLLNDLPAAYTELDRDPFGVFPAGETAMEYRLLSLVDPETETQALFLMAAQKDEVNPPAQTFDSIMNSIRLPESNANLQRQIASGDLVRNVLETDKDDIWTFVGEAGRYVSITLTPNESDLDLTLALIDPSGETLATADGGYGGDVEQMTDVRLPQSGIYIIEAGEFFNGSGPYTLNLLITDLPAFGGGGSIEFGTEVSSEIATNSEHEWLFYGVAGQDVTVIVKALSEQFDVILEMRGPDGRELLTLDEGFAGDTEIITGIELPVTGNYHIMVRGFAGHGGAYSLTLDEGAESTANFHDAGDLVSGEPRREFLQQDEAHAWFFYGETGNRVAIEVAPLEPALDLDIWLLNPDLEDLVMQDEFSSGASERIEFVLATSGQHLVLVRDFFGEAGEYEILLEIESEGAAGLANGNGQ